MLADLIATLTAKLAAAGVAGKVLFIGGVAVVAVGATGAAVTLPAAQSGSSTDAVVSDLAPTDTSATEAPATGSATAAPETTAPETTAPDTTTQSTNAAAPTTPTSTEVRTCPVKKDKAAEQATEQSTEKSTTDSTEAESGPETESPDAADTEATDPADTPDGAETEKARVAAGDVNGDGHLDCGRHLGQTPEKVAARAAKKAAHANDKAAKPTEKQSSHIKAEQKSSTHPSDKVHSGKGSKGPKDSSKDQNADQGDGQG